MKKCSRCKEEKDESKFYTRGKYLMPHCKLCESDRKRSTYNSIKSRYQKVFGGNYLELYYSHYPQ